MARVSKSKIQAEQGLQIGTSSTTGHVVTATDTSGNVALQAKPSYTFVVHSSFAIGGAITAADTVPTFFVAEGTSEVVTLEKIRYKIRSGTNVTFRLLKGGAEFSYGTSGSPLTATTTAATTTSSQAVADLDEIELDIIGISASPVELSVTMFFQHVVS